VACAKIRRTAARDPCVRWGTCGAPRRRGGALLTAAAPAHVNNLITATFKDYRGARRMVRKGGANGDTIQTWPTLLTGQPVIQKLFTPTRPSGPIMHGGSESTHRLRALDWTEVSAYLLEFLSSGWLQLAMQAYTSWRWFDSQTCNLTHPETRIFCALILLPSSLVGRGWIPAHSPDAVFGLQAGFDSRAEVQPGGKRG